MAVMGGSEELEIGKGKASLAELVAPGKAALLLVDMQNDFVSPKGKMAEWGFDISQVQSIVVPLKRLLGEARRCGALVIHTAMINDVHQNPLSWYAFWGEPEVALPESWGSQHIPELRPLNGELIINKYTYGAFFGTNLDTILRRKGITTVIVTGTGPNICAGDTLSQAFALGYHVVAVSDCLASFSKKGGEFNEQLRAIAMYLVKNHYGTVLTSQELIELWRGRSECSSEAS